LIVGVTTGKEPDVGGEPGLVMMTNDAGGKVGLGSVICEAGVITCKERGTVVGEVGIFVCGSS